MPQDEMTIQLSVLMQGRLLMSTALKVLQFYQCISGIPMCCMGMETNSVRRVGIVQGWYV